MDDVTHAATLAIWLGPVQPTTLVLVGVPALEVGLAEDSVEEVMAEDLVPPRATSVEVGLC